MTEKTVNVNKVVEGKDTLLEGVSESYYNKYLAGNPIYSLSNEKSGKPKDSDKSKESIKDKVDQDKIDTKSKEKVEK